ncbi:MAG: hypothetical protein ACJ759_05025 [Thermoanaerobaculia bacterium]
MKRFGMSFLALLLMAGAAFAAPAPSGFDAVLGHYEVVRQILLKDTVAGIPAHAQAIGKLAKSAPAGLAPQIAAAASRLAAARDLTAARNAFLRAEQAHGALARGVRQYRREEPCRGLLHHEQALLAAAEGGDRQPLLRQVHGTLRRGGIQVRLVSWRSCKRSACWP